MTFKKLLLAGLTLLTLAAGASADEASFPDRPVTLVVPFPAGGRADISARVLALRLQKSWPVAVLVVNRPGAGGTIGTRSVLEAKPDGYTLLFTSSALISAQYALEKAPRVTDFLPIGIVEMSYPVLVARKGLNFSLKGLPARGPSVSPMTLGTVAGATAQVATDGFAALSGVAVTPIPFRGEADTVAALLGGHIDLATSGWATIQGHVKAGQLEAVAVAAPARQAEYPLVPTFREHGIDLSLDVFEALFAPRDTPRSVVAKLEEATSAAMADEAMSRDMKQLGLTPYYLNATQSRQFIARQDAQFRDLVVRKP